MKWLGGLADARLVALFVVAACGCASAPRPAPTTTSPAHVTAHVTATETASTPAQPAPERRPVHRGPALDRQGCDPTGAATVVVEKDANGQPSLWRYFSVVRRGGATVRALKCEAVDSNGDGYVDARYFYGPDGEVVLEQRDLDFDGYAEVVADYSQFSFGHLTQARDAE